MTPYLARRQPEQKERPSVHSDGSVSNDYGASVPLYLSHCDTVALMRQYAANAMPGDSWGDGGWRDAAQIDRIAPDRPVRPSRPVPASSSGPSRERRPLRVRSSRVYVMSGVVWWRSFRPVSSWHRGPGVPASPRALSCHKHPRLPTRHRQFGLLSWPVCGASRGSQGVLFRLADILQIQISCAESQLNLPRLLMPRRLHFVERRLKFRTFGHLSI